MAKELAKAVDDYLVWMIAAGYASGTIMIHERLLNHFQNFITITQDIKECNQSLFHKVQLHHPTHRLSLNQLPNIFLQIASHV